MLLARPPLGDGVFRDSDALRHGLLTRAQLRGPRWRRLHRDVYCSTDLPVTHRLHAEAVALVAPPASVLGGLTAATLWSRRDRSPDRTTPSRWCSLQGCGGTPDRE